MTPKNILAVFIYLDLPCALHTRALKRKVKSADTRKERAECKCHFTASLNSCSPLRVIATPWRWSLALFQRTYPPTKRTS